MNRLAFGGDDEARIVHRLREAGLVINSLVAATEAAIVGHILFSRVRIETERGTIDAVALGPMSVQPGYQRAGIGAALIREGLGVCRQRGESIVIVVGHPDYYPRFGFSSELARNLQSPFSGEARMALELAPGALKALSGIVHYPPGWGIGELPG